MRPEMKTRCFERAYRLQFTQMISGRYSLRCSLITHWEKNHTHTEHIFVRGTTVRYNESPWDSERIEFILAFLIGLARRGLSKAELIITLLFHLIHSRSSCARDTSLCVYGRAPRVLLRR